MGNIIKDGSGSYLPMLFILPLAGLAELASLYSIQALLPKLSEVYHIPLNQVGMILSAEVGFLAFAMLFSGSLSDRFGRKPVIFASLFAGGVLTLLCALAPSWQVLVIFRALLGIAVSGVTAAITVYISEEVSPGMAGIITSYFIFGNSLGSMSGRVIATQMMEHFSVEVIFSLFGCVLIIIALVVKFLLPASRNFKASSSLQLSVVFRGGLNHIRNIKVSLCFITGFILFGSFTSIFNFLAFNLHNAPYNLDYTWIGLIPLSFSLTFFIAPYAARQAIRYGSMNVLSFLISFMMVGVFITFIAESVWLFISGVVLLSAAFFSSHSIILAWVSARTSSAKGQATSFYLLSYYSGGAVMGYVNGWLFAIQGWGGLAISCLVMLGIGLMITRVISAKYEYQKAAEKNSLSEII